MSSLISAFSTETIDIKSFAMEWAERYDKNKVRAFSEVIVIIYYGADVNSFIKIGEQDLISKPIDDIIAWVLNRRGVSYHVHEDRLQKIDELIDAILFINAEKIFNEKLLMNYLIVTLDKFSKIKWVSFRLVGAVVGSEIMTEMLKLISRFSKELISLNKVRTINYDKMLKKKQSQIDCLKRYFLILWRAVFIENRKSSDIEVRRSCYGPMKIWMEYCPAEFFRKEYFHALYCFLNDPDEQLRIIAVKNYLTVLNKYGCEDKVFEEKIFVMAIKRLMKRSFDSNIEICVSALRCLTVIDRLSVNTVESEFAAHIYSLVYHQHRSIATAAASFLHNRIIRKIGLNNSIDYIKQIVNFHIEAGDTPFLGKGESCDDFLIDALCNKSIMLSDWESWLLLLTNKNPSGEENGNYVDGDKYKTEIIIRLLVSSIKKYTTGMVPFNRIVKKDTTISKSSIIFHKNNSSEKFIEGKGCNLITLCHKYGNDDLLFCLLLSCFSYLNYAHLQVAIPVIDFIKLTYILHGDNPVILNECAKTYSMIVIKLLKENKLIIKKDEESNEEIEGVELEEEESLSTYILHGVKSLAQRMDVMFCELLENDAKKVTNMRNDTLEFLALMSFTDIMEDNVWVYILNHLLDLLDNESVTDMIEHLLMNFCFMGIFWIGIYFINDRVGEKKIGEKIISELSDKCNLFYESLKYHSMIKESVRKEKISNIISKLNDFSVYLRKHNGLLCLIYE